MNTDQIQFAFAFLRSEPAVAAHLLELQKAEEVAAFLENAPHHDAWRALEYMLPPGAAAVLEQMKAATAAGFLSELGHSSATAILRVMDKSSRHRVFDRLPIKFKAACTLLLKYSPGEVGAWMETNLIVVPVEHTIAECLLDLKKKDLRMEGDRIHIVSRKRHLVGTLSFMRLLHAHSHQAVASLVSGQASALRSRTGLASALKSPLWAHGDCVPVVNRAGELIGELHHHVLRRTFSIEQQTNPVPSPDLASALFQAYGDSVSQVFDIVISGESER